MRCGGCSCSAALALRSDGDTEYIIQLAEFVDSRMREISSGTLTVDSLKVAILAAYQTIVSGMGGNAGAQAMAVAIRGIALGEVDRTLLKRISRRPNHIQREQNRSAIASLFEVVGTFHDRKFSSAPE